MLGDQIESALSSLGLSQDRVERWLGVQCGCVERRDKLNSLHAWAVRIAQGKLEKAEQYLKEIMT